MVILVFFLIGALVYALTVLHLKKIVDLFKVFRPRELTKFELEKAAEKAETRNDLQESIANSNQKKSYV